MATIFGTVIIQAIISTYFVGRKKKGEFFLLNIYLWVVGLDFLFELLVIHYFKGDTYYLSLIPSSFRILKGPLLLLFSLQLLEIKIKSNIVRFLFLPFSLMFIYNVVVAMWIYFEGATDSPLVLSYHFFYSYLYLYYWIGFLSASIFILFVYRKKLSETAIAYSYLVVFILFSVLLYYISYRLGIDIELLRKIYTYMFLVQFALILNVRFRGSSPMSEEPKMVFKAPKYRNSKLQPETLEMLGQKVLLTIKNEELFRRDDISLEEVSKLMNEPKHYISQALTEGLNTTFYELINSLRLDAFLVQIKKEPEANISDLYYQCGFKSKTTFYKYFKDKVGLSPSEYKASLFVK